ncbi:hypothetical protein [Shinella granuli]|uniref:hypothetical protein n=1 Tax=Shinella granuli TaxID=323621 RepID=UPI0031F08EF4
MSNSGKVTVLEGGPRDRHPLIHIPAGFVKLLDSKLLYHYKTEEQAGLAGRSPIMPQGAVLGGGGSVNATIIFAASVATTILGPRSARPAGPIQKSCPTSGARRTTTEHGPAGADDLLLGLEEAARDMFGMDVEVGEAFQALQPLAAVVVDDRPVGDDEAAVPVLEVEVVRHSSIMASSQIVRSLCAEASGKSRAASLIRRWLAEINRAVGSASSLPR